MKNLMPSVPSGEAVEKAIAEFDAAQSEIVRLKSLADEKSELEARLLETADISDSRTFKVLSDCRMTRELIPSRIERLEALAADIEEKAKPAVFQLDESMSRAVNVLNKLGQDRIVAMLRPIYESESDAALAGEKVWLGSGLRRRVHRYYYGGCHTSIIAHGAITTGRRMLEVLESFRKALPSLADLLDTLGTGAVKQ